MTLGEFREMTAGQPDDMPIITYSLGVGGWIVNDAQAKMTTVHRAPGGGYGRFTAPRLEYRNDIAAIEIYA